jgi:hypothetical protein
MVVKMYAKLGHVRRNSKNPKNFRGRAVSLTRASMGPPPRGRGTALAGARGRDSWGEAAHVAKPTHSDHCGQAATIANWNVSNPRARSRSGRSEAQRGAGHERENGAASVPRPVRGVVAGEGMARSTIRALALAWLLAVGLVTEAGAQDNRVVDSGSRSCGAWTAYRQNYHRGRDQ